MKIQIDIPKEFEADYKTDKFKKFFLEVMADDERALMGCHYDKETVKMLKKALEDGEVVGDDNWILISQELPEIGEEVIVTTDNGRVQNIYYGYAYDSDEKPCFHEWDNEMWQCFKPNVIAWMKMPKAYMEGGD